MGCDVNIRMRVRDFPLALRWLFENYPGNQNWTVGVTNEIYEEAYLEWASTDDEYYRRFDEDEYREETIFTFDCPDMAMMFKLVWA